MSESGSTSVVKMVQGIHRDALEILQMAYPFQKSAGRGVVCLRDETLAPTKWPLAHVVEIHPGHDAKVHIVTIDTAKGRCTRPIVKMVPPVYHEDKS